MSGRSRGKIAILFNSTHVYTQGKEILLKSSRKESYDVNLPLRDKSNGVIIDYEIWIQKENDDKFAKYIIAEK